MALKVADVPLECFYKLTDRDGDQGFTKFYRFKNVKLLDEKGKEKKLSAMENLGLSPLPNGTVRLFSEYKNKDLAYVGGTETKYVPIGDRVEVNVGPDKDITIHRRLKDQKIAQRRRPAVQAAAGRQVRARTTTWWTTTRRSSTRRRSSPASRWWPRRSWSGSSTPTWCSGGRGQAAKDWDSQRAGGLRRSAPGPRPRRAGGPEPRQVFPRPASRGRSRSSATA